MWTETPEEQKDDISWRGIPLKYASFSAGLVPNSGVCQQGGPRLRPRHGQHQDPQHQAVHPREQHPSRERPE